jgi:adenylyl-sulfate kinase
MSLVDSPRAVLWMTGLSASGKTTLGAALVDHLEASRCRAQLLDGDRLRQGLNADLGFSAADRGEAVRRMAHVAALVTERGGLAVVSMISPSGGQRALAREIVEAAGARFLEVYVNTPLDVCEQRDPKGLYARARRGELPQMTGIGSVYEPPDHPDLELLPAEGAPQDLLEVLLALLRRHSLLPVAAVGDSST